MKTRSITPRSVTTRSITTRSIATKGIAALLATGLLACSGSDATSNDAHAGAAMNFHRINERLATSGHFVDDGATAIQAQGVKVVIDLRDKPPAGQKERLAALGMEWINVPVVWDSPQVEDFEKFRLAMQEHQDANVLVQCQANYRASAMTYLYRVLEDEIAEDVAMADVSAIWEPEGTWLEFINAVKAMNN